MTDAKGQNGAFTTTRARPPGGAPKTTPPGSKTPVKGVRGVNVLLCAVFGMVVYAPRVIWPTRGTHACDKARCVA